MLIILILTRITEISNKKTKIKSPRNSILNSQASTSRINNSIYTESQIEEIKRKLTEKV